MKFFVNLFFTAVVWIIALIPTWMYIGARSLLSPEGFFQEFFVLGIGIWFLGVFQVVLLIVGLGLMFIIWTKN